MTLSNHPASERFSAATRKRILDAAVELDYRPNFFAAGLSRRQTRLIVVCLSFLRDSWAAGVTDWVERQAASRGHRVLISCFQDREDPMTFHREILGASGGPGMIVVGHCAAKFTDDAARRLADQGVPMVMINRQIDHPRIASFSVDDRAGGELSARHAYEQDLDRVWALHLSIAGYTFSTRRIEGMIAAARALGRCEPRVIACDQLTIECGAEAVRTMLRRGERPQAVLATSDVLAAGAMQALLEAQLNPGIDVAVVGYDAGLYSACTYKPMTSIAQPVREMATRAVDALIDQIGSSQSQDQPLPQVLLAPDLIVRQTSVLPKKGTAHV